MFARLAFSILALAVGACVLLAARQVRIQAAHELAAARQRIVQLDAELFRLRAQIASRLTPERILDAASDTLSLKPSVSVDPNLGAVAGEPLPLQPTLAGAAPHRP